MAESTIVDYDSYSESETSDMECDIETQGSKVSQVILTDETGHIKWHAGQRLNEFEVETALGEGAFGRVLRVRNVNTGQKAALKVIKNEQEDISSARSEVVALAMIARKDPSDQSFCIKMLSSFTYGGHVCIAFPLLAMSVFDFGRANNYEPFKIDEVRHIAFQLCTAVQFLHDSNLIHTDLKTENMFFVNASYTIVFCETRKKELKRLRYTDIRLGDFGHAIRKSGNHRDIITTRYYRPPEVIMKLDWNHTCDIWSIGCVLAELHTAELLFASDEDDEQLAMMEAIIGTIPATMAMASRLPYFQHGMLEFDWQEVDKEVLQLFRPLETYRMDKCEEVDKLFFVLRQMLVLNPYRRMSLSDVLTMPFFARLPPAQRKARNMK